MIYENTNFIGKVNDIFELNIKENITTAYSWAIAQMPHNICFLHSYYTSDNGMIGSGGTRTFVFGGLAEGEGDLKLIHVRSWDLLNPIDTVYYHFIISPIGNRHEMK